MIKLFPSSQYSPHALAAFLEKLGATTITYDEYVWWREYLQVTFTASRNRK